MCVVLACYILKVILIYKNFSVEYLNIILNIISNIFEIMFNIPQLIMG